MLLRLGPRGYSDNQVVDPLYLKLTDETLRSAQKPRKIDEVPGSILDFDRFLGSIPTFDRFVPEKSSSGVILRASDPATLVCNFDHEVKDFIFCVPLPTAPSRSLYCRR